MSKIKSYFIHLKLVYKIIMLIVVPVVILGLEVLFLGLVKFNILAYNLSILNFAEVISDYFCFGGIYSKEGKVQNFYKTSARGKQVYLDVFWVHGMRRIIMILGISLLCLLMTVISGTEDAQIYAQGDTLAGYYMWIAVMIFAAYAYSIVGAFVCRKLDMPMVCWGIAIWGTTFLMMMNLLGMMAPLYVRGITLTILVIISVAGTLFLWWYNRKKMEDSYYDEKHSERN